MLIFKCRGELLVDSINSISFKYLDQNSSSHTSHWGLIVTRSATPVVTNISLPFTAWPSGTARPCVCPVLWYCPPMRLPGPYTEWCLIIADSPLNLSGLGCHHTAQTSETYITRNQYSFEYKSILISSMRSLI